jgi:alcohol dehydrogenase class IV
MIHQYNFPTTIRYGVGSVQELPGMLKHCGLRRPLLVTDRSLAGLPPFQRVHGLLSGFDVAVHSEIFGNPLVSQAVSGGVAFRGHAADSIVALGGGAALDVAKCIAVLAHHDGALLEYEAFLPSPRPIDLEVPPVFMIPTTAGTGSEVGRSAVVSDDQTHRKKIIFSPRLLAKCVFLDPELTVGLPASVTAATGMDAVTHCVESYLAKAFHPMCDGVALEGLRLAARHLPRAVAFARAVEAGKRELLTDPAHLEARGMMLNVATMGAVAFQKDLGVVHSCAHALSTVADLHHGLANGIVIPYGMAFNAAVAGDRMGILAQVSGTRPETAQGFIDWLHALKAEIGIPRTLAEVGVRPSHLKRLVEVALADACHQFNPRPVGAADFRDIFQKALG